MTKVWYVAYGSNLSAARFRCYIEGGLPDGGAWSDAGCGDATVWADDRPVALEHPIRFAGRSTRWGGGVAFLDEGPGSSLGRAYLLDAGQLLDVLAQENRGEPGALAHLDVERLLRHGVHLDAGWYRTVLRLGELDGLPMLTITGAASGEDAPPSDAYLRHMSDGLRESHGLAPDAIAAYLSAIPGVGRSDIASLLA